MVTLCWAAKGGSGTTVVAAALALTSSRPSLLVDLDGELPAVLGIPEPDRPGVAEWLSSSTSADHLADLLIDIAPQTWLLPWKSSTNHSPLLSQDVDSRWATLGDWLHDWSDQWGCDVTVDAGTGTPPSALGERSTRLLLVTRACYLSVRRGMRGTVRPTGVVLIDEPGHGLRRRDVAQAIGAPVETVLSIDPAVASAVDAGLLAAKLPYLMVRALRRVAA